LRILSTKLAVRRQMVGKSTAYARSPPPSAYSRKPIVGSRWCVVRSATSRAFAISMPSSITGTVDSAPRHRREGAEVAEPLPERLHQVSVTGRGGAPPGKPMRCTLGRGLLHGRQTGRRRPRSRSGARPAKPSRILPFQRGATLTAQSRSTPSRIVRTRGAPKWGKALDFRCEPEHGGDMRPPPCRGCGVCSG